MRQNALKIQEMPFQRPIFSGEYAPGQMCGHKNVTSILTDVDKLLHPPLKHTLLHVTYTAKSAIKISMWDNILNFLLMFLWEWFWKSINMWRVFFCNIYYINKGILLGTKGLFIRSWYTGMFRLPETYFIRIYMIWVHRDDSLIQKKRGQIDNLSIQRKLILFE